MADIDMRLDGTDAVLIALRDAQPAVKEATVPVIEMATNSLAARARASVNTARTHNLWKGTRGRALTPRYNVKRPGTYWFRVETPTGAVGKAQAMAEFASRAVTNQGAALISSLSSTYGRSGGSGGGRILYQARDEMDLGIKSSLGGALDAAARTIEQNMGGV